MIANQPTLDEVKSNLRIEDSIDDVALQEAVDAVAQLHALRLDFPMDDAEEPAPFYDAALRQAFTLRVARLLDRRNSPSGVVGFADYGPTLIARTDIDAAELEAPYMKVVLG